jgi:hypothetical protein
MPFNSSILAKMLIKIDKNDLPALKIEKFGKALCNPVSRPKTILIKLIHQASISTDKASSIICKNNILQAGFDFLDARVKSLSISLILCDFMDTIYQV